MKKFYLILLLSLSSILLLANELTHSSVASMHDEKELNKITEKYEKIFQDNPEDTDALLILGIAYHNISVGGNQTTSEIAHNYLKKACELDRENALALVYLGSARTLMGRDAANPLNKIKFVDQGIALIDTAVAMDESNIDVRLVRLNNSPSLPDFFKRQEVFFADVKYFLELTNKNPNRFDNSVLEAIYYFAGEMFKSEKKLMEAKEYWEKTIAISTTNYYKDLAEKELEVFFDD